MRTISLPRSLGLAVPPPIQTAIDTSRTTLDARLAARRVYEQSCSLTSLNGVVNVFMGAVSSIISRIFSLTPVQYPDAQVRTEFLSSANGLRNDVSGCLHVTWPSLTGLGATPEEIIAAAINRASAQIDAALAARSGQTTTPTTPTTTTTTPTTVTCPVDTKTCPDGSVVSRVAPDCNFPACPTATTTQPPAATTSWFTDLINSEAFKQWAPVVLIVVVVAISYKIIAGVGSSPAPAFGRKR